MPKLREQVRDLHKVPLQHAQQPFCELAFFLHRCIEMDRDWSPETLMSLLEEHREYASTQLSTFGYTVPRSHIR